MSNVLEQLEKWGTESLSPDEIKEVTRIFGDRAQVLLEYYSN